MITNARCRRLWVSLTAGSAIVFLTTCSVFAQVSPAGGGADRQPTAAKASEPSPETGKQLEPQLFGFILIGGGVISAIAVVLTDRRVRAKSGGSSRLPVQTRRAL